MYFTVSGKPFPQPRPRVTRFGTYEPGKGIKAWKAAVAKAGQNAALTHWQFRPYVEPLQMTLQFCLPMPKSWTQIKKDDLAGRPHVSRPDADNLAKAVMDALQGICYLEDSQIFDLAVAKHWVTADCAGVGVSIQPHFYE